MRHIAIIGNGISGITAARHIRKQTQDRITIISAETDHFFSRTALMYIYMGHMKYEHTKPYEDWFWRENKLDLKRARVEDVDVSRKRLLLQGGEALDYDVLILAVGSRPNRFGWPGQDLAGVQGLYSYQDLELLERNAPNNTICKRAVIVGGGLIGIELAEMLHTRNIPVTFLVRESSFWNGVLPEGDSALINEEIREHQIDLRLGVNLREILSDDNGKARGVVVNETGEEIACDLVGLTAGVTPNIGFLRNSGIELDRGVLVNRYLETNIQDVYAIGDCAQQREAIGRRKPIEAVWYTGRMMGETVAQTICGNRMKYNPGNWFNSAKFFNVEYQTYGWVSGSLGKIEGERHFHWRHPHEKKAITVAFDENSGQFLGINSLGIRMRHEVFDQWLNSNKGVDEVIANLASANFDPEFYSKYEPSIRSAYERFKVKSVL